MWSNFKEERANDAAVSEDLYEMGRGAGSDCSLAHRRKVLGSARGRLSELNLIRKGNNYGWPLIT